MVHVVTAPRTEWHSHGLLRLHNRCFDPVLLWLQEFHSKILIGAIIFLKESWNMLWMYPLYMLSVIFIFASEISRCLAFIWQPLSLGGTAQNQQQTQPQAQVDLTQSQQSQALASSPSFANYVYDPSSGYYYNSTTGLYYDANTQVLLWNKYWILLKITWLLIDWHQLHHSPNLLWPKWSGFC